MPKKLIIVEDDFSLQKAWKMAIGDEFGNDLILIQATTIQEARKALDENPDVDIIAMDACVPGNSPNTIPLVERIRVLMNFKGPMIAISGSSDYRKLLMEAGCDMQCPKEYLMTTLKKLLEGEKNMRKLTPQENLDALSLITTSEKYTGKRALIVFPNDKNDMLVRKFQAKNVAREERVLPGTNSDNFLITGLDKEELDFLKNLFARFCTIVG